MFPSPAGRVTRLSAGAWLRRITAALAAVTGGVLAWPPPSRPPPPRSSRSQAMARTGLSRPRRPARYR